MSLGSDLELAQWSIDQFKEVRAQLNLTQEARALKNRLVPLLRAWGKKDDYRLKPEKSISMT